VDHGRYHANLPQTDLAVKTLITRQVVPPIVDFRLWLLSAPRIGQAQLCLHPDHAAPKNLAVCGAVLVFGEATPALPFD